MRVPRYVLSAMMAVSLTCVGVAQASPATAEAALVAGPDDVLVGLPTGLAEWGASSSQAPGSSTFPAEPAPPVGEPGEDPEPDLDDVVPDPAMRAEVNRILGHADRSAPVSATDIASLEELNLRGKGVASLEGIQYAEELRRLDATSNELVDLPEELHRLKNLEVLNLQNNRFTELPENIGELTSLWFLSVGANRLTALPDSIGQLKNLRRLHLIDRVDITIVEGNEISELPESIGNLTNLEILNVPHNSLTGLPESIGNLTKLWRLDISGSRITELPDSFGGLTSLQYLYAEGNQLSTLPESFGELTSLQLLGLSGNQLSTLPESFGGLEQLEQAHLGGNRLVALPESTGNLAALRFLNLRQNNLTELPESVGDLPLVERVNLSDNAFPEVPGALAGIIAQLRALDLSDNPGITSLPWFLTEYPGSSIHLSGTGVSRQDPVVIALGDKAYWGFQG